LTEVTKEEEDRGMQECRDDAGQNRKERTEIEGR